MAKEPKTEEVIPVKVSLHEKALASLNDAIVEVRAAKPGDHSAKDRYFAIVLTKLEEAVAIYQQYVVGPQG